MAKSSLEFLNIPPEEKVDVVSEIRKGLIAKGVSFANVPWLETEEVIANALRAYKAEIKRLREALKAELERKAADSCGQNERDKRLLEGIENHEIIYYGPHPCDLCGDGFIVRGSVEQGVGDIRFDYPNKNDAVIYPNRNWTWHQCAKKMTDECGQFTGRSSDGTESHCRMPKGHGGSCNPLHGLRLTL